MPILGGPCSPQGQVRHVADLFRQIRHGNRNKTAKYVLDRVYIAGEGLQHPLELIWPKTGTPKVLRADKLMSTDVTGAAGSNVRNA